MPSAAGPLLMHARDCFEFSLLFFFPPTAQLSVTACRSFWAHCYAAQDTDLEKGREQRQQHLSRAHPLEEGGLWESQCSFPDGGAGVCETLQRSSNPTPVQSTPQELGKTGKEMLNWRGVSNAKEFEENAALGLLLLILRSNTPVKRADIHFYSRSIHSWHTGAHWVTSPVGSSLAITLRKDYPTLIHTDSSFCKQLIGNNIFTY